MPTRILNSTFGTPEQVSSIATFLLEKEQYILDNYPFISYFGTDDPAVKNPGTFVTTRSGTYNVLNFVNELPILNNLKEFFAEKFFEYVEMKGNSQYLVNPAVNCWVNIVRKQESISFHKHAEHENSFVSASMVLKAEDTSTWYKFEDGEIIKVPNTIGNLSIFPCNVYHWTDIHLGQEPRITLGMDFFYDREFSKPNTTFYNSLVNL